MRYCQEKGIVCQYAGTNMHCRLTACVFPRESVYPVTKGGCLMDVEKLIERLKCPQMCSCPMDGEYPSCWACQKDIKRQAADAFEKLQAENEKLRTEKVKVIGNDELMDELQAVQAENDKLRADVVRFNDMLASYQNVLVPELRVENENLRKRIEDTRLEWYAKGFGEVIAEVKRVRGELEQTKRCIEIIEKQRDSAIEELENYMVQDVVDGNEPCGICAKASDTPCECCDPKWRGPKED